MTLVLVVIAGSTAFVTRGRAVHRTGESIARLEEALDAALALLVDEIRLAGYLGLAAPRSPVDGASTLGTPERADLVVAGGCGPSLAHDLAVPIVAVDAAYAAAPGVAIGCRPSPDGRAIANWRTRSSSATRARKPCPRRQAACSSRRTCDPPCSRRTAVATLGPDARRHDLEVGVYYVSRDSTGRRDWPSLRRKRLVGGTRPAFQDEELVSGIADLQILLGLDDPADADTAIDRWIQPGEPVNGAHAARAAHRARSAKRRAGARPAGPHAPQARLAGRRAAQQRGVVVSARARGSALVVVLVLLSGLGALALAAAAAAMTALALAGHQQMAQNAFEAAETGIVHRPARRLPKRAKAAYADGEVLPEEATAFAEWRAETREAEGPGILPPGFTIGENAGSFAARHFFVTADASSGRGVRARLEQGFYLVVPAP